MPFLDCIPRVVKGRANHAMVVADHSNFVVQAPGKFSDFDEIDTRNTDPRSPTAARLAEAGVMGMLAV